MLQKLEWRILHKSVELSLDVDVAIQLLIKSTNFGHTHS